jgi:stearoyl-CoA 9-desaturase NADPH oxidoreductase
MPERGATPNVHPLQRRLLRRLATLSSPLLPDDYLELINPLWSTRELRGRIESIDRETRDAATVLIKPGYRWGGHQPGQYLRIGLDIKGVRHWRAYSVTSDPSREDGLISITVKNVDEGKVSPYLVQRGRPGTIGVAGEEQGLDLPYGCREGVCHTCVGELRSGQVRDLRTGKVHGEEGETIRTCIHAPEGPIEIEL